MKPSELILTLLSPQAHKFFPPKVLLPFKTVAGALSFPVPQETQFTTTYPREVLESAALTSCVSPTSACHKCPALFPIVFYCNARWAYNTWALQAALFVFMLEVTTGTRTKLIVNIKFDVTSGDRILARRSIRSHSAYLPTSQISAVHILYS